MSEVPASREMTCDDCGRVTWHTMDNERPYPQCAVCGAFQWGLEVQGLAEVNDV